MTERGTIKDSIKQTIQNGKTSNNNEHTWSHAPLHNEHTSRRRKFGRFEVIEVKIDTNSGYVIATPGTKKAEKRLS